MRAYEVRSVRRGGSPGTVGGRPPARGAGGVGDRAVFSSGKRPGPIEIPILKALGFWTGHKWLEHTGVMENRK